MKNSLSSIKKLSTYFKMERLRIVLGIIMVTFTTLLFFPVPYLNGKIIDLLGKNSDELIYHYITVILILYILRFTISIVNQFMFNKVRVRIVNCIKVNLLDKLLNMPMSFLNLTEKGYILSRISEANTIGNLFKTSYINIFFSIFEVLITLIILFHLSNVLAIIVIILMPIYYIFLKKSSNKFTQYSKATLESYAVLNGEVYECLNNIENIKIHNTKDLHLNNFLSKANISAKQDIKLSNIMNFFAENFAFIGNINMLIILCVAMQIISVGTLTIGAYITIVGYAGKIFSHIQSISTLGITIAPIITAIDRVFDFLTSPDDTQNEHLELNSINQIEFRKVSFSYNDSTNVLDDLSFSVDKGSPIYIKGSNGTGKTSIAKLILGVYTPKSGEIYINDINIREIRKKSLLEKVAYISKDIILVHGSVEDNILYSNRNCNSKDIIKMIDSYNMNSLLDVFKLGLNTKINADRSGLSLGQIQIISILRGLLTNRDVVIFDEPLANLDTQNKQKIIEVIEKYSISKISIIISHDNLSNSFKERLIDLNQ